MKNTAKTLVALSCAWLACAMPAWAESAKEQAKGAEKTSKAGKQATTQEGAKEQAKGAEKASKAGKQATTQEGAKAQSGKGFDTSTGSATEVKASTGTKANPVGQPVTDYKAPVAKSLKTKEPPPPQPEQKK